MFFKGSQQIEQLSIRSTLLFSMPFLAIKYYSIKETLLYFSFVAIILNLHTDIFNKNNYQDKNSLKKLLVAHETVLILVEPTFFARELRLVF